VLSSLGGAPISNLSQILSRIYEMLFNKHVAALLVSGLTLVTATGVQAQSNVALGASVTASSFYNVGTEVFPAAKVTDGITVDSGTPSNWSFWLAAEHQGAGQYVTVDLGGLYDITSVTLFDSHNRGYFDRGTDAFHLSVSTDGSSFTTDTAWAGAFTTAEWQNQTAKDVAVDTTARYVRFNVDSIYGSGSTTYYGAGLAEIQVYGTAAITPTSVPEPDALALVLAGVGVAGFMLRRRSAV
jgi:hypothetical protein